jgi:3-mercaptopyruvate sulfurtransferase SseA
MVTVSVIFVLLVKFNWLQFSHKMYPTVVSPEWLLENQNQPEVRVFDVTFFEDETIERAQHLFAKEHIMNSF